MNTTKIHGFFLWIVGGLWFCAAASPSFAGLGEKSADSSDANHPSTAINPDTNDPSNVPAEFWRPIPLPNFTLDILSHCDETIDPLASNRAQATTNQLTSLRFAEHDQRRHLRADIQSRGIDFTEVWNVIIMEGFVVIAQEEDKVETHHPTIDSTRVTIQKFPYSVFIPLVRYPTSSRILASGLIEFVPAGLSRNYFARLYCDVKNCEEVKLQVFECGQDGPELVSTTSGAK